MHLKRLVYLLIEKALSFQTDKIVCISEAERESALKNNICHEEKLCLIPNGIDIAKVQSAIPVLRSSLGFHDDDFVVGMVGRLARQKAPDVFVKAATIIQHKIPKAVFLIVGNGEETARIENYAKMYGLKLVVTGWVDNPYSYLKIFDVAMLLSRWEGFGLAITEYMAARKPYVATRVDAIPTLVEDGFDGFLVGVDSPEEAADRVVYIYNHKKEIEVMVENAYKKVTMKYDIHRVAEQHKQLFDSLMKE